MAAPRVWVSGRLHVVYWEKGQSVLVDSHCHLDRLPGGDTPEGVRKAVLEAREAGVGHILCVAIDLESYPRMRELIQGIDGVSVSVGVHPNEHDRQEPSLERLLQEAEDPAVVAIGETGLDYFREEGDQEWQRRRFRTHIRAARETGLPLVIHTRDARDDTLRVMEEEGADVCGGVMHCFTESWEMAKRALEMGFYLSFSGIVTFRNADSLREVARRVPLDRLLVETDSPYLAPVPHRGKPNRPAWVVDVARRIAEERGMTEEALAAATTENFFALFRRARRE